MNTLNQNKLVAVCGGFDPLNTPIPTHDWDLQWFMDQLAQQQDEQRRRYLLGESAD